VALAAVSAVGAEGGAVVVDRIVAVVDEDPIFLSDVERFLALGNISPEPGIDKPRRRALDRLIDQRLRFHEVERHGFIPVSAEELDAQLEALTQRLGGPEALERRLAEAGIDRERLRYLLSRQLRVSRYIEERLGPRIFVDLEDVRAYYEGELADEMVRRGESLPPLDEVREPIRALLRERRLNREIEVWTAELRERADVVDHLDRLEDDLPPVVDRLEN